MFLFCVDTNKHTIYNKDGKRSSDIMKKEIVQNVMGVMFLYLILICGIIAVNARIVNMNEATSASYNSIN